MTQLVFEYSALQKEIEAFGRTAQKHLDPMGIEGLKAAVTRLRDISAMNTNDKKSWETAEWAPIRTIVSPGAFMPGDGGGLNVVAILKFKWEIRNLGTKRNKLTPFRQFELVGIGSARIDLLKLLPDGKEEPIAMWRFEVGCGDHPGCYFHTQVLQDKTLEEYSLLFPHALDVPRLPGFLFTPVDALEFVLGELFQDKWSERALDQSPDMLIWRAYQQARLVNVLTWQRKMVADASGSPWMALKGQKPQASLLVDGTA